MTRLPKRIRAKLKKEAQAWDFSITKERPEEVSKLIERADLFVAYRPPRQPVSVRLDPFYSAYVHVASRKS